MNISFNNTTFYPYYGHLPAAQRRLYEQLLPGYQAGKENISVTTAAHLRDVSDVITAIYCDHPEIIWMSQKVSVRSNAATGLVASVSPEYLCGAARITQMRSALNSALREYLSSAAGKDPIRQERLLHDKMVNEVSYVHGANDQTAYGALVEHKAVCAGYTRAFQLLMQQIGIPCYYCRGDGKGSRDISWAPHAWNILKLGSDYYNLDITWADCYERSSPGKISYRFYNCDDTQIAADHRRAAECAFLPACKGTRYTFRGISGVEPEKEEIRQDGLTCRQTIRSAADFERYILPEIRRTAGKNTDIAFSVEVAQNFNTLKTAVTDILKAGLSDRLYRIRYQYTDYHSGWYRFQITITYDDPLEQICREGVSCRQVIRSASDFSRYILPEIRKTAGKPTTVSFPVQTREDFESLQKAMSESIRHASAGRSCRWSGSWKHYCDTWYRMEYRIEYK